MNNDCAGKIFTFLARLGLFRDAMKNNNKSWFKQFWPWFLIGLPMVAVVGSISLVFTAIDHQPDMVVDDYYSKGKAINNDFALINRAKELDIHAAVQQTESALLVRLEGVKSNASISFSLYHSTLASRDIVTMLTADAKGEYRFESEQDLSGKWTLRIEPFDKAWRLQKTITLPRTAFRI